MTFFPCLPSFFYIERGNLCLSSIFLLSPLPGSVSVLSIQTSAQFVKYLSLVTIFLPSHNSTHIWRNLSTCWILSAGKDFKFTKRQALLWYVSTINSMCMALLWSSLILTTYHSVRITSHFPVKVPLPESLFFPHHSDSQWRSLSTLHLHWVGWEPQCSHDSSVLHLLARFLHFHILPHAHIHSVCFIPFNLFMLVPSLPNQSSTVRFLFYRWLQNAS